jgi:hypothetical protein
MVPPERHPEAPDSCSARRPEHHALWHRHSLPTRSSRSGSP